MRRFTGAFVTLLAVSFVLASPATGHVASRPCSKLFSLVQFDRAAQATYRGTRTPSVGSYGRLWRYARCQRPPSSMTSARGRWRVYLHAWEGRRHAPPPLPYGEWAIPAAIVMCESRGENLSPNGAGASGYYQIIPSTWSAYGGAGSDAYLAAKPEQDMVASRIWDGGRGASQWVCAGIVGDG